MAFNVTLDRLQSEVFKEIVPGNVVTLAFGRGSGKSFLLRVLIHTLAMGKPGTKIGLLLPSLKQAKMVFWPQLTEDFTGPLKGHVRPNFSDLTAVYSNGSRLSTWGAENAHSIRGQRFDVVVEDECDDIDKEVETAVVQPTFSKSGRNAIWVKAGTPRRGRHGILYDGWRLGQLGSPEGGINYKSYRFPSSLSPQVDQVWLASVKATTNPAVFAREYECDFDSGEGLVYPFDEAFHVKEPPEGRYFFNRYVVGVDHGWADPGVMVLAGIHGHGNDAVLWILDEWYETEIPSHIWDERAQAWQFAQTFWCDPSRPDRINAIRSAGPNAQPADNNIEGGIARVADMLFKREPIAEGGEQWARMYVHPKCKNTIAEFNNYRRKRDPRNHEQFQDTPEDRNNHAMDSVRYLSVGEFGRGGTARHTVEGS